MRQVFLNARVYAKHKINLTWPYITLSGKRKQNVKSLPSEYLNFVMLAY